MIVQIRRTQLSGDQNDLYNSAEIASACLRGPKAGRVVRACGVTLCFNHRHMHAQTEAKNGQDARYVWLSSLRLEEQVIKERYIPVRLRAPFIIYSLQLRRRPLFPTRPQTGACAAVATSQALTFSRNCPRDQYFPALNPFTRHCRQVRLNPTLNIQQHSLVDTPNLAIMSLSPSSSAEDRIRQITQHIEPKQASSSMATNFDAAVVPQAPEDPLFGLMAAYRKDTDPRKVDLGIGAYRDDNAKPWVLPVVRAVSRMDAICARQAL